MHAFAEGNWLQEVIVDAKGPHKCVSISSLWQTAVTKVVYGIDLVKQTKWLCRH